MRAGMGMARVVAVLTSGGAAPDIPGAGSGIAPPGAGSLLMPILLRVDELEANMRLARPITLGQRVLLPAGKVLNGADVDALRARLPRQMVSIADPMLDEMVRFADDSHDRAVSRAARRRLFHTLAGVRKKIAGQMSLRHMDFRGVHEAVAEVVEYIRDNPVVAAILSEHRDPTHYLTEHPANVFYLSLVLGNAVRGYVQRERSRRATRFCFEPNATLSLTPLALAALFQDISLWPLEELYRTSAPLTGPQRELVRRHPLTSSRVLPDDIPERARVAVEHHHESFDGSGYPRGLADEQIDLFGRILRICDAFDAATAKTVYAQARSAARALGEMVRGPYARNYDPVLLKVFSNIVQPYPIGAKLRLNCGRYGVVVRYGEVDPFLPVIVVAFDADGSRLGPGATTGPYPLHEHREIVIQSFGDEDLSDLYSTAAAADPEPVVISEFGNLFESSYP